jgi:hypothetical protein
MAAAVRHPAVPPLALVASVDMTKVRPVSSRNRTMSSGDGQSSDSSDDSISTRCQLSSSSSTIG